MWSDDTEWVPETCPAGLPARHPRRPHRWPGSLRGRRCGLAHIQSHRAQAVCPGSCSRQVAEAGLCTCGFATTRPGWLVLSPGSPSGQDLPEGTDARGMGGWDGGGLWRGRPGHPGRQWSQRPRWWQVGRQDKQGCSSHLGLLKDLAPLPGTVEAAKHLFLTPISTW